MRDPQFIFGLFIGFVAGATAMSLGLRTMGAYRFIEPDPAECEARMHRALTIPLIRVPTVIEDPKVALRHIINVLDQQDEPDWREIDRALNLGRQVLEREDRKRGVHV